MNNPLTPKANALREGRRDMTDVLLNHVIQLLTRRILTSSG
jgi:hypothetical protein